MTAGPDHEGYPVPADWTGPVDVEFDGVRVFSVDPTRGRPAGAPARDRRREWPKALRPYLTGSTEITFRDHVSGGVLAGSEVRFDDSPTRTAVVDDEGEPLALTKWGSLSRTFSQADSSLGNQLLDDLDEFFALSRELGVDTFIGYGTLLGAVRNGRFIGHDNDADVIHLSHGTSPATVAADSFRLQRALRQRGWGVRRNTAGFLHIWPPGRSHEESFDVFAAYVVDGHLLVDRWVRGPAGTDAVLPLGEVTLEGRTYPAPARPDVLLELTYGPGWQVPDPAFKFRSPDATLDRARSWLGLRHWAPAFRAWDDEPAVSADADEAPTSFAEWSAERVHADDHLLDVGCRSGVDGTYLAARSASVLGFDQLLDQVDLAAARAAAAGASAEFLPASFHDRRHLVALGAELARRSRDAGGRVAYCRRIVERLEPQGRDAVWMQARTALRHGGRMLLDLPADGEHLLAEATARGARVVERVSPGNAREWFELAW